MAIFCCQSGVFEFLGKKFRLLSEILRRFDGLLALARGKHLKMAANCGIIVINVMMAAQKL